MKRKIITTADGSKTIQIEEWNEQYHSLHGAIQEANHVYINKGLLFCLEKRLELEYFKVAQTNSNATIPKISLLEVGFGTGLNALLTLINAEKYQVEILYVGVEAYPISSRELEALNYSDLLGQSKLESVFRKMHEVPWHKKVALTPLFSLQKQQKLFKDIIDEEQYDLIYFDAFGARVQPELWTETIFRNMFNALKPGGVLVTYAAKGSVRRAMRTVGFKVEKLEGPPGKREMLRALKSEN